MERDFQEVMSSMYQKRAVSRDSVSCPQTRATANRREKLGKTYESKEWQDSKNEFVGHHEFTIRGIVRSTLPDVGEAGWFIQEVCYWYERKKPCSWCGSKISTLPHHPYSESYKNGTYTNLQMSGCVVVCNRCHYAIHHGLLLCKRCHTRYHGVGADFCKSCWLELHPEIVKARADAQEKQRLLKKRLRDEEKARVKKWKLEHIKST